MSSVQWRATFVFRSPMETVHHRVMIQCARVAIMVGFPATADIMYAVNSGRTISAEARLCFSREFGGNTHSLAQPWRRCTSLATRQTEALGGDRASPTWRGLGSHFLT